jgi:hypothetical protein
MAGISVKVERPRDTSKSVPNKGSLGTRASAEAISFCSSAEGAHTFNMLTFTCGCWELPGPAGCCCAARGKPNNAIKRKLQRIKMGILGTPEF